MNSAQNATTPEQNQQILDVLSEGVYGLDAEYRITFVNRAMENMLGWTGAELIGQHSLTLLHKVKPKGSPFAEGEYPLTWIGRGGAIYNLEELLSCKDGSTLPVEFSMTPVAESTTSTAMIVVFRDITERKESHRQLAVAFHDMAEINGSLDKTRTQLQQAEKLAGIGQLASGMAQEVHHPIGFVQTSLISLDKYVKALLSILAQYGDLEAAGAITPDNLGKIHDLKKAVDYEFLREDMLELMEGSRTGIERVRKIIQSLREYSQEGRSDEWTWLDVQLGAEIALSTMQEELAGKCTLHREYGKTPEIYCLPKQINFVFSSLIANAAQSFENRGDITLRSGREEEWVWLEVADNGCGIPADIRSRIFEPFFTTKPAGVNAGMGLATAQNIIKAHGGRIEVSSRPGKGSSFTVWLPIKQTENFLRNVA